MLKNSLLRTLIFIIVWTITAISIQAQQNEGLKTYRGLYWMDEPLATEVYLSEKPGAGGGFSLTIISQKDITVFYRTSINSREDVNKELCPFKAVNNVKYYEVKHHFSRTTIWMGLEFKLDDKVIDSLTRTFYDDLFEIVPNDGFLRKPV